MTCRLVGDNFEKFSRMYPASITLFAIASLIPFTPEAFSTINQHTRKGMTSVQASGKLSLHILGQSLVPSNDNILDTSYQQKDVVIIGAAALKRLSDNTNYIAAPMSEKNQFLRWAREISKRKLLTDKEFKERVKVRELKKFHDVAIKRWNSLSVFLNSFSTICCPSLLHTNTLHMSLQQALLKHRIDGIQTFLTA